MSTRSKTGGQAKKPAGPSEKDIAARDAAAMARIETMDDPDGLRNLMANAERLGVIPVRDAAFRQLALVQAQATRADAAPGSVAQDFWQTIFAFEQLLKEERGKTIRLSRTRQKITRVGEVKTLADFASATSETQGFEMLMARNMPEMTGEAVILRHPDDFDQETRDAATERLELAGVDIATLVAAA